MIFQRIYVKNRKSIILGLKTRSKKGILVSYRAKKTNVRPPNTSAYLQ